MAKKKKCIRCLKAKNLEAFHRLKKSKDGRYSWCKECVKDYMADRYADPAAAQKRKDELRRRYHRHPEGNKAHLKRKYGITVEQYNRMFESQGGKCASCGLPQIESNKRFAVDHDHETGMIRGLLCQGCNCAAGHLSDSPLKARALADYLERTQLVDIHQL